VNFASPPAIPISPVSYPPSPESTRISPAFPAVRPSLPSPTDYREALQSDPFEAEPSDGEDDRAIHAALQNAMTNVAITAPAAGRAGPSREDAVKDTLGRFAPGPRRPASHPTSGSVKDQSGPPKHVMDVDAFKRLLLTGDSGTSTPKETAAHILHTNPGQPVSDSSSSTDSASISQPSIFETVQAAPEASPRSSYELETDDTDDLRPGGFSFASVSSHDSKKPPPPPPSRRGKPIKEHPEEPPFSSSVAQHTGDASSPLSPSRDHGPPARYSRVFPSDHDEQTSSGLPTTGAEPAKSVPPAPPLSRRKSQNTAVTGAAATTTTAAISSLSRNNPSRHSGNALSDVPPSPSSTTSVARVAPPPPPSRRSTSASERRSSLDNIIPLSAVDDATKPHVLPDFDSHAANLRPPLGPSRTSSSSKRLSQGHPPPLPPPRRNRGSSKNSMDGHDPSAPSVGLPNSARNSGDFRPQKAESGTAMGSSNVVDILADLAALQKEVDAARASARNG